MREERIYVKAGRVIGFGDLFASFPINALTRIRMLLSFRQDLKRMSIQPCQDTSCFLTTTCRAKRGRWKPRRPGASSTSWMLFADRALFWAPRYLLLNQSDGIEFMVFIWLKANGCICLSNKRDGIDRTLIFRASSMSFSFLMDFCVVRTFVFKIGQLLFMRQVRCLVELPPILQRRDIYWMGHTTNQGSIYMG